MTLALRLRVAWFAAVFVSGCGGTSVTGADFSTQRFRDLPNPVPTPPPVAQSKPQPGAAATPSPAPRGSNPTQSPPSGDSPAVFSANNQPPGGWRPPFPSSPLFVTVPASPRLDARSATKIAWLRQFGWEPIVTGKNAGTLDYGIAHYYGRSADPVYRITNCTNFGGDCPIAGLQVHIPRGAQPETGADGHLSVFDQALGRDIDFYAYQGVDDAARTVTAGWGGYADFGGDGLGSEGVHSKITTFTGIVRPADLLAGNVPFALHFAVPCSNGHGHYPADTNTDQSCNDGSITLVYGDQLWLDMSESEIAGLSVPAYMKAILTSMHRYGAYMADTGTGGGSLFQFESKETSTSFGLRNGWLDVAARDSVNTGGDTIRFDLSSMPWDRLKIVDPCVARQACL